MLKVSTFRKDLSSYFTLSAGKQYMTSAVDG
jgi:hypothetical protein